MPTKLKLSYVHDLYIVAIFIFLNYNSKRLYTLSLRTQVMCVCDIGANKSAQPALRKLKQKRRSTRLLQSLNISNLCISD
jgi:hypothetical protein